MENNEERIRREVIEAGVMDLLGIRIFNAQRQRHIRIAFFFHYRKRRRSPTYAHLTNEQIRDKTIKTICKRLRKIALFASQAEQMFMHTEHHRQALDRMQKMSILEIAKARREGVKFTLIDLRTEPVILL